MATLRDLKVSFRKAVLTEDHSTYRYHIACEIDDVKWEVAKRFSEFDVLLQSLAASKYAGLPKLPSKTILGSPTDTSAISGRKEQLRIILNDLLIRPDTRTSQALRQFLAIDSHVRSAIRSLQPDALRTFEDPRFGVSGLCVAPSANLLLITHEDSTHLSRLGRVWSVVEPDELGALHLWTCGSDSTWKRISSRTYGLKVRSLAWEDTTRQFFVGLEDGKIEVYSVGDRLQSTQIATLELHHKSPVTHLSASSRKLLSLGFDTAIRAIDVKTRELLCGGRLFKRLRSEMDYLTCGALDDERDRAFIGTSGGDVFVLDIARNPPSFLHTVELGSRPCSQICAGKDALYIVHSDCVSVMSFEEKGNERQTKRVGSHRAKYLCAAETTLLSLALAPERELVFGGYSDGSVAIWRTRESEAVVVLQAHSCDTTQLAWVETPGWGPALMTGGGDGKVITWTLTGGGEEYSFWLPQSVDEDGFPSLGIETLLDIGGYPSGGSLPTIVQVDAVESSRGDEDDLFRLELNPRVNPKALKSADDSSDEDVGSLLR